MTKTKLWPPIHEITYTSGAIAWQVACMVKGTRIREAFPIKKEAETRAAQIRAMVGTASYYCVRVKLDGEHDVARRLDLPGRALLCLFGFEWSFDGFKANSSESCRSNSAFPSHA
jgi:hypothetical protein